MAIRTDNRISEKREHCTPQVMPILSPTNVPEIVHLNPQTEEEPMQLGRTRLTPKERERETHERGSLFLCGGSGHMRSSCPELALKAKAR